MSRHYLTFLTKPLKSWEQSHFRISTLFSLAVRILPRCFLWEWKLEVVHKEVGGYLTRCALRRWSLKLIIMSHSLTQSVRYVGIELLEQLRLSKIDTCVRNRCARWRNFHNHEDNVDNVYNADNVDNVGNVDSVDNLYHIFVKYQTMNDSVSHSSIWFQKMLAHLKGKFHFVSWRLKSSCTEIGVWSGQFY